MNRLLICFIAVLLLPTAAQAAATSSLSKPAPAKGPLRVHPKNPRYFTDGTKMPDGSFKAIYLTGAHTWNKLADMAREDPPAGFDFDAYLDFLDRHGHNFILFDADIRRSLLPGKPDAAIDVFALVLCDEPCRIFDLVKPFAALIVQSPDEDIVIGVFEAINRI